MLFEIPRPETTTIIRWLLRVVLVVFLAWLVRRQPEQEEEEEENVPQVRAGGGKGPRATGIRSSGPRPLPRRDPYATQYPSSVRQRRPGQESVDFDSVIEKLSKPKEMWEVRKSGEPLQILRRQDREDGGTPSAGASAGAGGTGAERVRRPAAGIEAASARDSKLGKECTLRGHERPVTYITWNRDCNLLFTCGKDKTVCVWSCPEGECLGNYQGHSGAVWSCSVTSDSRWLVTSGADRLVIVWEARNSKELARVELPGVVRFAEWAGGGGYVGGPPACEKFVTCHNRFGAHPPALTVYRFDGTTIEELRRITSLPTPASQVRWGRGDYFVASAHDNGELIFWRADTGAEVKRLKVSEQGISKFDFSSDRELVATASTDMSLSIWDVGKGSEWKLLYSIKTDRPLNAVALGPITRGAAVGPLDQRPDKCCAIAAGGQDVRDVAGSSSATDQFGTLMFRLGTAESLPCDLEADGATKGHFGPVHTLAFARDGSAIASGSEDGMVRLNVFEAPQVMQCAAAEASAGANGRAEHD